MKKSVEHSVKLPFRERIAKPCFRWLEAFGCNPLMLWNGLRGFGTVWREYRALRQANRRTEHPWPLRFSMPYLSDRFDTSGSASGHYFHQDLLVARQIFARNPVRHVDVGSRVDGFVAHVASFREIEVFDIRPQAISMHSIVFRQMDLMQPPSEFIECCDSLSCLHALEHFGLGRYGDPLDLQGHLKGVKSLTLLLRTGGTLYLSVPIGSERIEFNANRVFAVSTILELTRNDFDLLDLSYVDDTGKLHQSVALDDTRVATSFGCQYGCGIFELRKK